MVKKTPEEKNRGPARTVLVQKLAFSKALAVYASARAESSEPEEQRQLGASLPRGLVENKRKQHLAKSTNFIYVVGPTHPKSGA